MAMQAQSYAEQEPDSRINLHQEGAAHDLKHCVELEIQVDAIEQKRAHAAGHAFTSATAMSADVTRCSDVEDAGGLCMQPLLKRLRLQTDYKPAPLTHKEEPTDDGGKLQLNIPVTGDKQTCNSLMVSVMNLVDDSEQAILLKNGEQMNAVTHKADDSAHDADANEEDEESECVTPKAGEHRIPESKDLVCPPPPIKRKPTAFKRIVSTRHSACNVADNHATFLISPPDLHTYPDCIRALFDK
ncbi:hypothetical protein GOP47_0005670 [Adiantum capillus-veneris]|uniref:Uncharacterized protein n=1 Tax=Adiantum capillus-veneris TaxID=13818 RepID=A0A9D4V5H7_ADICA|nr:hypothetical protein GOP47_0005670 [Adiantum capillus-veneris]